MLPAASFPLRPGGRLDAPPGKRAWLHDPATSARHEVAPALVEPLRAAVAAGATEDAPLAAWLEARHLRGTERVSAVEAWALARKPAAAPGPPPVRLLPGTRFSCHGCGACCVSYLVTPVPAAERRAIEEGAETLAPFAHAPPAAWFERIPELDDGAPEPVFALARRPDGSCVFLGPDKRCEVERRLGREKKPTVCRRFPLSVTSKPDETVLTVSARCETLYRSREDGAPLETQRPWLVETIRNDPGPLVVPKLLRLAGDVHVPYELGRTLERRALAFVTSAPAPELALLATRDLVFALERALPAPPAAGDLDRADRLVATATLDDLSAAAGDVDPSRALESLGGLLAVLLVARGPFLEERARSTLYGDATRAGDALFFEVVTSLYGAHAPRFGWPPTAHVSAEAAELGARASAVGAGAEDPAAIDFVRSWLLQEIGAGRLLVRPLGIVAGFAHLVLAHALARFGARLLAARRGAAAASAGDWNRALAVIDNVLRLVDITGAAPLVATFARHLFRAEDLPT